jgi:hypothetical protein
MEDRPTDDYEHEYTDWKQYGALCQAGLTNWRPVGHFMHSISGEEMWGKKLFFG